jgi:membrane dipeptidase
MMTAAVYVFPVPGVPAKMMTGRDMSPEQRKAFLKGKAAIDAKWPVPRANLDDYMKHMLHAIQVAGVDHVGMSGDFDGGGGLEGLDQVSDYPKITAALLKAGYTKDDVAKIWGGNALRVLKQAQMLADPEYRAAN